jgi:primase-polymerase (primpol)-like protein
MIKKARTSRASWIIKGNGLALVGGCAQFDFEVHDVVDELVTKVLENVFGTVYDTPLGAVNAECAFGGAIAFGKGHFGRKTNAFGRSFEGQVPSDGVGIPQGIRGSQSRHCGNHKFGRGE